MTKKKERKHGHLLLRSAALGRQGHKVLFTVLKLFWKVITTGLLAIRTAKINNIGGGIAATAHGTEDFERGNASLFGRMLETDADVVMSNLLKPTVDWLLHGSLV